MSDRYMSANSGNDYNRDIFLILKFRHHFLYFDPLVPFGHMLIKVSFTSLSNTCNQLDHMKVRAQYLRLHILFMYASDKYILLN